MTQTIHFNVLLHSLRLATKKSESSNFVVPEYCGQMWWISSYGLKIHGENMNRIIDPSSTRIFHFILLMMMKMKTARLYISLTGKYLINCK